MSTSIKFLVPVFSLQISWYRSLRSGSSARRPAIRIAAVLLFPAPKRSWMLKSSLPVAMENAIAHTVASTCPSLSATIGSTTARNQSSCGMFIFWCLGVKNLRRRVVKSDCSTAFLAGIIAVAVSGIQWMPSPQGRRLLGVWATASSSLTGLVWPKAKTSHTDLIRDNSSRQFIQLDSLVPASNGSFFFPASAYWPVWPGQSTVSVGRKLYRSI